MDQESLRRVAEASMPRPEVTIVPGSSRHDVIRPLTGKKNVGIELGVAAGSFSQKIVSSGKFQKVFGVDTYDDYYHHVEEYRQALRAIGLLENYSLLRMTFEDARALFDDNTFDFIYVDGFAHTGQEGGRTLSDWWPTLKVGGVMAGDDYHTDWPLVMWAVNEMASQLGLELHITDTVDSTSYNRYPSWYVVKTEDSVRATVKYPETLRSLARQEATRVAAHRRRKERRRARKQLANAIQQSLAARLSR
jgi:hypothetical protein